MDVIEMRNKLYDTVGKIGWEAIRNGEDPTREEFEEAFRKALDRWFAEELEIILSRTEKEVNEIKMADCFYCRYFSGRQKKYASQGTCEYVTIVGHSRPCLAGDCRQAGVWEEKQKNKKAKLEED